MAALALADAGRRVAVLERGAAPQEVARGDVRALVLSAASVAILQELDVWPRLEAQSCAVRHIRVSEAGVPGEIDLDAEELNGEALGWSVPADILLQAFRSALLDRDDVAVHWSSSLTGFSCEANAVRCRYAAADGEGVLSSALLIGADGAGSQVRDLAGIALESIDYQQQAVVAPVRAATPIPATAIEHFTAAGALALIPTGDNRYVSVQCLPDAQAQEALALDDDAYAAMLTRRSGRRLGRLQADGRRRAHALVRQQARPVVGSRVVLIGNAANTVHPNAAQGLNLGLRDVAALRRCVGASGDAGEPAVLTAYRELRAPDHARTSSFTHVLAQGFRSQLGIARLGRRLGMLGAGFSATLRRRLLLEASGLAELDRIERWTAREPGGV